MTTLTGEERALARAAVYRILALSFSYPDGDHEAARADSASVATRAAGLLDEELEASVRELEAAVAVAGADSWEADYQRTFTLSYSEDCPIYETAFSARHLFQQTHQLADLAGFYSAFGVAACDDRADHIASELEFCYLLTVKEAEARAKGDRDRAQICRRAQRSFLRDHLARWAPLVAGRTEVAGAGTPFAAAARALGRFVAYEERFLRLGSVSRYRDEPAPPEYEPGDLACPLAGPGASLEDLMSREEASGVEIQTR